MKQSLTTIALAVSALLLETSPSYADTLDVGNRLNNSGFATDVTNLGDPLDAWVITSGTVNQRNVGTAINADSSPLVDERNTFDGFFTSGRFLVLGDVSGAIGGDNQSGAHSIIQHFRTPGSVQGRDVLDLSLNLSFDYAFDGITDETADGVVLPDQFTVTLQRIRANPINNGPINTVFSRELGINDVSQFDGHMSIPLTLEIGALYRLTFSLFEDNEQVVDANRQAFNSALGLDNVRIEGTAEVAALPAPVPLPPAAYLMASATAALGVLGRRRSTLSA
jgi:hypothetical protein